ncbi:MAG: N-acetylmuramoyl-L-alanine amidase [Synergistaceae bacterium]|nr:N-acetylmuramoyl-L-alanine amidase [Synergistaceae bacterium]
MKKAAFFTGIFAAAFLLLVLASACVASEMPLFVNGVNKGVIPARTEANRTYAALDTAAQLLGCERKDISEGTAFILNGKKAEVWDKSEIARVNGIMSMFIDPVCFADGHWWAEYKSAEKFFNSFCRTAGINAAVSFSAKKSVPDSTVSSPVKTKTNVKPVAGAYISPVDQTKDIKRSNERRNELMRSDGTDFTGVSPDTVSAKSGVSGTNKDTAAGKESAEKETAAKEIAAPKPEKMLQKPEKTAEQPVEKSAEYVQAASAGITKTVFTKKRRPVVVIDAGHGAHDPGALGHGVREKDINLKAATELGKVLKSFGASVMYTRSTDVFLKLQERTAFANKHNADVFVSLHCNSLPKASDSIKGIEIYLMASPRDKDSLRLAIEENKEVSKDVSSVAALENADKKTKLLLKILGDMQQNNKISESTQLIEALNKTIKSNGLQMRKVSQAPFFVLRGAGMPAVLIEMGYLSSAEDASRLNSAAYRERLVNSLAQGIVDYIQTHIKL